MWTKRVVPEGRGRDPSGLSRVGDTIKDFLLGGINTRSSLINTGMVWGLKIPQQI